MRQSFDSGSLWPRLPGRCPANPFGSLVIQVGTSSSGDSGPTGSDLLGLPRAHTARLGALAQTPAQSIPFGVIRDFKFGGFTGSFPVGLPRARRRTAVQATVSVALMIKTYQ
jgi:hypothetical protein